MSLEEWTGRVHPDDRNDTCFAAIVAGQITCGSNEFRIFTDSCDLRWLSCKRRAVVEYGRVVGVAGIVVDITTEKRREEVLSRQAATDPLTGLANRRRPDEIMAAERDRAVAQRLPLSLLMIDVDHFKRYNDLYGHQAGDRALKHVARCLKDVATEAEGTATRFGGEEFSLLLPGKRAEEAAHVARALIDRVRALAEQHRGSPVGRLTVSIGVAGHPRFTRSVKADLVAFADAALYRAKEDGRDCCRIAMTSPLRILPAVA